MFRKISTGTGPIFNTETLFKQTIEWTIVWPYLSYKTSSLSYPSFDVFLPWSLKFVRRLASFPLLVRESLDRFSPRVAMSVDLYTLNSVQGGDCLDVCLVWRSLTRDKFVLYRQEGDGSVAGDVVEDVHWEKVTRESDREDRREKRWFWA